jgi:hypothetical protein
MSIVAGPSPGLNQPIPGQYKSERDVHKSREFCDPRQLSGPSDLHAPSDLCAPSDLSAPSNLRAPSDSSRSRPTGPGTSVLEIGRSVLPYKQMPGMPVVRSPSLCSHVIPPQLRERSESVWTGHTTGEIYPEHKAVSDMGLDNHNTNLETFRNVKIEPG